MKKAAVFICVILIICVLGGVLAGCSGGTKSSYKIDVASAAGYDEAEFVASLQEEKVIPLSVNGESNFKIVCSSQNLQKDAEFLRDTLRQMTGAEQAFEVVSQSGANGSFIFLGKAASAIDTSSVKDDGYAIKSSGGNIYISGNYALDTDIADDGTANGIYSFLEDVLGCMFVRDDYSYVPKSSTAWLDDLDIISNPDFVWRRIYQYEVNQNNWSRRIKSNGTGVRNDEVGNDANRYWGTWCHSSFRFVDPDVYFEEHPEYFAVLGGERRHEVYNNMQPQLCLSAFVTIDGEKKPAYDIIKNKLAEDMAAHPEAVYWDFSINDGYHPCECEECAAAYEKYGSHAGLLLHLVNNLAKDFPDKYISTLAYQHMRTVPQGVKCESNVNIVIAPIQTSQLYSYKWGDNDSSAEGKKIIEEWAQVCDNLFIWDYTVNFHNLLLPYPNLAVQKDNLEFYLQNNVRRVFHQGSREQGDEMACLRSYILAKQLWDADVDINELLSKYVTVTYGAAAPYIAEYIDLMHEKVQNADDLDLYDKPSWHATDYLSVGSIAEYQSLMDSALSAVQGDETLTRRVEEIAINVDYAKMYELSLDVVGKQKAFERLSERAEEQGIERFHEVQNLTEEFIQTIYPEYLSKQKAYLALAVVLPVVAVGAAAAICIVVIRKKKKALHAETDRTQSKTSD